MDVRQTGYINSFSVRKKLRTTVFYCCQKGCDNSLMIRKELRTLLHVRPSSATLTGLPPLAGNKKMQRTTFQREAGGRKDVKEAESLLHTFLSTRESFAQTQTKNFYLFSIERGVVLLREKLCLPSGKRK
jgi:hypothetical protein